MPSSGSCKICESVYADIINRLIAQEKNEADCKRVLIEIDPDFYWTRQTFYTHKKHITHPLISAARRAQNSPVIVPQTTEGFLELVRQEGARKVAMGEADVKLRDALKASEILDRRSSPKDQTFILLAKAMTLSLPEEIQGEFRVLPNEEDTEGGTLATHETGPGGRTDTDSDRLAEGGPEEDSGTRDENDLFKAGSLRDPGRRPSVVQ